MLNPVWILELLLKCPPLTIPFFLGLLAVAFMVAARLSVRR